MLVKFIQDNKRSWEDYLDQCVYAYNTARHESSRYTPFELMFSRKAVLPIDLQTKEVSSILLERQAGASLTCTCAMYALLLMLPLISVKEWQY